MTAVDTQTILVRLFGRYRDLDATSTLRLELPATATVADLVAALRRQAPDDLPARPLVAVNHRPAGDTVVIGERDEVALIPPVAGG